jgi:hypothetical protein
MSDKKIDEHRLVINKISVGIQKTVEFETDYDYAVSLLISIVEERFPSNHDGTVNKVWIGKPTGEISVNDKFKKKCYTKKKGTHSQQWWRFICGEIVIDCRGKSMVNLTEVNRMDNHYERSLKIFKWIILSLFGVGVYVMLRCIGL